jgi:hypothetical protein
MPQLHLGALELGGFDLGALAFFAFVFAQLVAVIALRRFNGDARDATGLQPRAGSGPREAPPPSQPALQS